MFSKETFEQFLNKNIRKKIQEIKSEYERRQKCRNESLDLVSVR